MKKVAVFGGTFNPPTLAHESIIHTLLGRKDIDQVWLMPSGERSDKPEMLSEELRLAMLSVLKQSRFSNDSRLVISDFELTLDRPTQTYKTVTKLLEHYPGVRFGFVFGTDSYLSMNTWARGRVLRELLDIYLVPRSGVRLLSSKENVMELELQDDSYVSISSTMVRRAISEGQSVRGLISQPVRHFICQYNLYQEPISRVPN